MTLAARLAARRRFDRLPRARLEELVATLRDQRDQLAVDLRAAVRRHMDERTRLAQRLTGRADAHAADAQHLSTGVITPDRQAKAKWHRAVEHELVAGPRIGAAVSIATELKLICDGYDADSHHAEDCPRIAPRMATTQRELRRNADGWEWRSDTERHRIDLSPQCVRRRDGKHATLEDIAVTPRIERLFVLLGGMGYPVASLEGLAHVCESHFFDMRGVGAKTISAIQSAMRERGIPVLSSGDPACEVPGCREWFLRVRNWTRTVSDLEQQ